MATFCVGLLVTLALVRFHFISCARALASACLSSNWPNLNCDKEKHIHRKTKFLSQVLRKQFIASFQRKCSNFPTSKYQLCLPELSQKMSINRFEFNDRKHASIIVELLYKSRDRTADVHFVYHGPSGGTVRIPAHRNVLGMGSTILYDLFFGPHKITGDIPTKSTTVTAQTFESFISLLYGKKLNRNHHCFIECISTQF